MSIFLGITMFILWCLYSGGDSKDRVAKTIMEFEKNIEKLEYNQENNILILQLFLFFNLGVGVIVERLIANKLKT